MIKIKNNINLYDALTCGQIFRYIIKDNTYILFLSDRIVKLIEEDDYIKVYSSNEVDLESIILNYLGMNIDYDYINNEILKNNKELSNIIEECNGFRIMNTPKLETIISYMISANNNVRNIEKCVNLLCNKYGEKVEFEDNIYYLFPTLEVLKTLTIEDYNNMKFGFRSKYVYEFVNTITNVDIDNINNMTTNDAIKYLTNYKGIGLKIASCILLFGYNKLDVYPIDTWVKKYMYDNYKIKDIKKIEEFAKKKYKEYSGVVIQYMFHSKRNKGDA